MSNAEEAKRLIDNGYSVLIFKDGLGKRGLALYPKGERVDEWLKKWRLYDPPADMPPAETVFAGMNRYCGCGHSIGKALHAVAEKVILGRLPDREPIPTDGDPDDPRQ